MEKEVQENKKVRKKFRLNKKIILISVFILAVILGISGVIIYKNIERAREEEALRLEEEKKAEEARLEEERIAREQAEAEKETEEDSSEEDKSGSSSSSSSDSSSSSSTAGNCTVSFGNLVLINPNFTVTTSWIATRKTQLISVSKTYGITEAKSSNGDNLMDSEAAKHLNEMVKAYENYNSGHTMQTRSCFRQVGTNCGRLCAKTGTSDHHTGLTCDLIDSTYGTTLSTDDYSSHKEWQWLKANSYKYGFIDRFPEAWVGGSMSAPINVDANGTTGLFETWHYRYVGVTAATEIATGKYNNGKYDSLEHYLKSIKKVSDLKNGKC